MPMWRNRQQDVCKHASASTPTVTGASSTYLRYHYGYNSGTANNGRIAGITDDLDSRSIEKNGAGIFSDPHALP